MDGDAPSSTIDESRQPFAFEIVAQSHDRLGQATPASCYAFGPVDGCALSYLLQTMDWPSQFRFEATAPVLDLIVDCGHLRRLRISQQHPCILEFGERLDTRDPGSMGTEVEPPPPPSPDLWPRRIVNGRLCEGSERDVSLSFGYAADPRVDLLPTLELHGRVRTSSGAAAHDFSVRAEGPRTFSTTTADRDGRYSLTGLLAGTYKVSASSALDGSAQTEITLRDLTTELDLQLLDTPTLHGRVVDSSGAPVPDARLLWCTPDGGFHNHALTAADGTFALGNLKDVPASLWACVPGKACELPAVGRIVVPGETVEFVLDASNCQGSLLAQVAVPAGFEPYDVSARLWQQDSGLGVRLTPIRLADHAVTFGIDRLPAGNYTLELCCPGFGVVHAGTHWCDGHGRIELTSLALPEPAHITFVPPPGEPSPDASSFAIVRHLRSLDVRLEAKAPTLGPQLLGPGDYAACWLDAHGERHAHSFTVHAGAILDVQL